MGRFLDEPSSWRYAARVIILANVVVVLAGSVVIWLFDRKEFSGYGDALWFTLQTVTTVGYGDNTPTRAIGRVVAAIVMLAAIGFIAIVTATITSTFVEASRRKAAGEEKERATADTARVDEALAAIVERLDRIEATLEQREKGGQGEP
jgi:voltage-gated potassium channel